MSKYPTCEKSLPTLCFLLRFAREWLAARPVHQLLVLNRALRRDADYWMAAATRNAAENMALRARLAEVTAERDAARREHDRICRLLDAWIQAAVSGGNRFGRVLQEPRPERLREAIVSALANLDALISERALRTAAEAKLAAAEQEVARLTAWGLDMQRNAEANAEKVRQMADSDSNRALRERLAAAEQKLATERADCSTAVEAMIEEHGLRLAAERVVATVKPLAGAARAVAVWGSALYDALRAYDTANSAHDDAAHKKADK